MSEGRGSTANVIAALASIFIAGLGQLVQGRPWRGLFFFVVAGIVWFISFGTLGWIIHIWSCVDAAVWRPEESR